MQNISSLIFGFGGFYLLVRTLSKEDFGGWTLFITATSIFEVARIGLIKNGFIKYRAANDESIHGVIFTASLILNFCFALFITAITAIFGAALANLWNTPQLKEMFYMYSITSIVLVPFFQFEILQHSQLNFKNVFIIYSIRNGFLFLAILLGYFGLYEITLLKLVIYHLGGATLAAASSFLLARNALRFYLPINWDWVLKLIHYGKYVIGTSISSMLYGGADQFMLGSIISTTSVAMYSTASRITNLINIPSMTLSTIMFPKSAALISTEGPQAVKRLYEKSVGTILGVILPCVVLVLIFPDLIINVVAGEGYADAVPILEITAIISIFLPFSYQFGTVFDSIGMPNLNFYYTSASLLTNIILNYFLILNFGIYGAVYGTLSISILGFISMQTILNIKLKVNTLNVFKYMFAFYSGCYELFVKLFKRKLDGVKGN